MKRIVEINGHTYVATYDTEGVLDTVTREGSTELLVSTHRDVKRIVANADAIANFKDVKGVRYVKGLQQMRDIVRRDMNPPKAAKKEAKDLQPGDVFVRALTHYTVTALVPIGNGGYVEIQAHQIGKPDNVMVSTVPCHMEVDLPRTGD